MSKMKICSECNKWHREALMQKKGYCGENGERTGPFDECIVEKSENDKIKELYSKRKIILK